MSLTIFLTRSTRHHLPDLGPGFFSDPTLADADDAGSVRQVLSGPSLKRKRNLRLFAYASGSDQTPSRDAQISRLFGREKTCRDKLFAELEAKRMIHVEHRDGRTADRGTTDKVGPLPAKVPMPLGPPRVEQRRQPSCFRVEAGDVRSLMAVIVQTGETGFRPPCVRRAGGQ